MPFEKKFELTLYVPATVEPAGDMPERWANGLKNNALVMNDRRQAKVPDSGTFNTVMARPATLAYGSFVNPAYRARSGRTSQNIKDAHGKNLGTAYNFWNDKTNKMFATQDGVEAKLFKEKVDGSKDRWAIRVADKTLRFTGDKIRGRGISPIVSGFLSGDARSSGWVRESGVSGTPYDISRDGEHSILKTAINQRIVQGGMMILNADANAAVEIIAQNALNTSVLNGLRDSAKCDAFLAVPAPDKCFCAWALNNNLLYLWVQVGITV